MRVELDAQTTDEVQALLMRELALLPDEVYEIGGFLDPSALWFFHDRPARAEGRAMDARHPGAARALGRHLPCARSGDILLQHPYDSFETSVEAFVEQAAKDPQVLAIKQALYRTSEESRSSRRSSARRRPQAGRGPGGAPGAVRRSRQHHAGKDAGAGRRPRRLRDRRAEDASEESAPSSDGRPAGSAVRPTSGRELQLEHGSLYEDIGLLTADPDLGADLTDVFNLLTGYSRQRNYRRLLVAPTTLKAKLIDLMRAEAEAGDGSIAVMKMNSLVDADAIDALYEASRAGVSVDLIVRGMLPASRGCPGLSDRIRVRSIVGRYLEHSRIFRLGARRAASSTSSALPM